MAISDICSAVAIIGFEQMLTIWAAQNSKKFWWHQQCIFGGKDGPWDKHNAKPQTFTMYATDKGLQVISVIKGSGVNERICKGWL